MAKLNRERRLLERRHLKQVKKEARKRAAAENADPPSDTPRRPVGPGPAAVSVSSTPAIQPRKSIGRENDARLGVPARSK